MTCSSKRPWLSELHDGKMSTTIILQFKLRSSSCFGKGARRQRRSHGVYDLVGSGTLGKTYNSAEMHSANLTMPPRSRDLASNEMTRLLRRISEQSNIICKKSWLSFTIGSDFRGFELSLIDHVEHSGKGFSPANKFQPSPGKDFGPYILAMCYCQRPADACISLLCCD